MPFCDPHILPGRLAIDASKPLETQWKPFNASGCPNLGLVQTLRSSAKSPNEKLPPIFNALFEQTLLVIGDSVDRNNVEESCNLLCGSYTIIGPEHPAFPQPNLQTSGPFGRISDWKISAASVRSWPRLCRVPVVNFSIVSVFSTGMDQEDFFAFKDSVVPPSLLF